MKEVLFTRPALAAAVLFLALSAVLNRELLPHLWNALPGDAGDPMLNAWILGWVSKAVISQPLALWDAPIFHPHPNALAFSEHLMGIAVFVAPVYWLSGDAILTYNVAFLLGFAFLGWAAFALTRAITGRADAAVVAGVLLMCSPYFVSSQVARLQMLSAGWSLLAFLGLHRWLERGSWPTIAAFAACWILQFKSNVYLGLFLSVPVALILAASFVRRSPALTARRAGQLSVAALAIVVLSAPPLLQYADAQAELGLAHSPDEVRRYSASLRSYASVCHDRRSSWLRSEDSSDRALFPGTLLVLFAAAGAGVAVWRSRADWRMGHAPAVYLLIAVTAFLFTLGPEPSTGSARLGIPGPFAWLTSTVPAFGAIRAPGRLAVFVVCALAVLAGVGAAAVLARLSRATRVGVVVAVTAVALWDGHRDYDWLALLPAESPSATAAYAWLAEQPRAAVLEMPVVTDFQGQRPYAGGSVTLRYQLAGLRHGHPLVNGSSGFVTPLATLLQSSTSPFTTLDTVDDALRALRAIGTRYVVTHRHEYLESARGHAQAVFDTMAADTAQVEDVRAFGDTTVFVLRPGTPAVPPTFRDHVARADYVVEASAGSDAVTGLLDDDLGTRWRARQDGDAWLDVQLRRARVLHGVKFAVPRFAVADYPHHLRVVGTGTDGAEVVLFDGPVAFDAAMTAVFEPAEPGVRLIWPPMALSKLRIEQPVAAGDRPWSIYELHLLGEGVVNDPDAP